MLEPINDLAEIEPPVVWRSLGDDPRFVIRLPFIREKRYLVFRLSVEEGTMEPQLYVNFGLGFKERQSFNPRSSRRHAILIDVGGIGTVRSIRLDPNNRPGDFTCHADAFRSRAEAEAVAEAWCQGTPGAVRSKFGRLSRLIFSGLPFGFGKTNKLAQHLEEIYQLAAIETAELSFEPSEKPFLSLVVPVYNAPDRYLDELLRSFRQQMAGTVELILSDDASPSSTTQAWLDKAEAFEDVTVVRNPVNRGIAETTNSGIAVATGEWIALLDHDDAIAPSALALIRATIERNPGVEFLYTDEVVTDGRLTPTSLMAKPAYDPVLLSGVNYINHFSVYRAERLRDLGGLRPGFEGSQDYDLLLRYLADLTDDQVIHLPYPAYWWRRDGRTYSRQNMGPSTDSARRAMKEAYSRRGDDVDIVPALTDTLHKVEFLRLRNALPKLSVIIPNKNGLPLIQRCLSDLMEKTDYPDFEVVIIDNGTTDPSVLALYDHMTKRHDNISVDIEPAKFNFSRAVNQGIAKAKGEHFLLLNNDISVIDPSWLREMVACLAYEKAGIVGAKLLYPNDKIQHAGVIAGFGGLAGHWYLNRSANFPGPMNRLHVRSSMSCVTGAAMLISGDCHAEIGAFDEENFPVAYNDVDYCLRAYRAGWRVIWTPFACLHHHESATRGSEKSPENKVRFEREKDNLRRLHRTTHFVDPASSPLHSRDRSNPELQKLDHLPQARHWLPKH